MTKEEYENKIKELQKENDHLRDCNMRTLLKVVELKNEIKKLKGGEK